VIACHLAGFPGAVASLGTAFTADHARTVERYATDGLVLMFDGDRAGMQAAERAVRELANTRLSVRIALMSDADGGAKDPADVVVQRPGEDMELVVERRARFADVIDGAEDHIAVWFRLLRRRIDLSQATGVEAAAQECAAVLALVESPVRQAALLEQMARHLAVPAPTLERLLQKQRRRRDDKPDEAQAPAPVAPRLVLQPGELEILACLLAAPRLLEGFDPAAAGDVSPALATLFDWAIEAAAVGRTTTPDLMRYMMTRADDRADLRTLLGDAFQRGAKTADPAAVLNGLLAGRRRIANETRRRLMRQQLQQALAVGDSARAAEIQNELLSRLREDLPRRNAD
jgi:DNA primase